LILNSLKIIFNQNSIYQKSDFIKIIFLKNLNFQIYKIRVKFFPNKRVHQILRYLKFHKSRILWSPASVLKLCDSSSMGLINLHTIKMRLPSHILLLKPHWLCLTSKAIRRLVSPNYSSSWKLRMIDGSRSVPLLRIPSLYSTSQTSNLSSHYASPSYNLSTNHKLLLLTFHLTIHDWLSLYHLLHLWNVTSRNVLLSGERSDILMHVWSRLALVIYIVYEVALSTMNTSFLWVEVPARNSLKICRSMLSMPLVYLSWPIKESLFRLSWDQVLLLVLALIVLPHGMNILQEILQLLFWVILG